MNQKMKEKICPGYYVSGWTSRKWKKTINYALDSKINFSYRLRPGGNHESKPVPKPKVMSSSELNWDFQSLSQLGVWNWSETRLMPQPAVRGRRGGAFLSQYLKCYEATTFKKSGKVEVPTSALPIPMPFHPSIGLHVSFGSSMAVIR